jgi:hypothetical protein
MENFVISMVMRLIVGEELGYVTCHFVMTREKAF